MTNGNTTVIPRTTEYLGFTNGITNGYNQQSSDNERDDLVKEIVKLGKAALAVIEHCPTCKHELQKKVKSDGKSDSTAGTDRHGFEGPPDL